jgi:hypothetical protein
MLNTEQICLLFDELKLPRERITEGSPIDIVCPCEKLHSLQDGRRTCRLFFQSHPHLHCFHDHCLEAIRDKNTWLRLLILGSSDFPEDAVFGSNGEQAGPPGDYQYARKVTRALPKLIKKFSPESWNPSPIPMSAPEFLARLDVFKRNDRIWIGDIQDSGRPLHEAHFRTLAQWKTSPPHPSWSYTTGAAFLPGAFSRSVANVYKLRALILESDSHPQLESVALARWVEDEFSLPLLAIVYSGKKSLHCYFPHPGRDWLYRYKPALVAAGFDQRAMGLAQPIRLANQVRIDTGKTQSLLWLRN